LKMVSVSRKRENSSYCSRRFKQILLAGVFRTSSGILDD
ncbi:MAG: hypothetical protein ACI8Q1_000940, partial [Parvicella sp.]